ncbi:MAG TPA: VWA-like domain-containing protein [Thiobacillaceae bacterium]|nr:VWA-like domain-containing protein [Thiobacillaceae bacterium]
MSVHLSRARDAATKLAAARTRLILDKPFLGALVLRLPMQEAGSGWCRTTATDMRSFYYNPAYIERLSLSQAEFVLAHEALHCALLHFVRRGHRVQRKWDLACDFAINPLLFHDGLIPPPEAVILNQFDNMTAEEIYPCLDDSLDHETLDQHLYDNQSEGGQDGEAQEPPVEDAPPQESSGGGKPLQNDEGGGGNRAQPAQQGEGGKGAEPKDGPPQPLTAQEREQLAQKWQQYVASAAQQAAAAGKLGGAMARLVETWLQPKLPWRSLLAHYFFESARTDYTYMRPSRREGDMIMPSLKSPHSDMVVALDTSGSINDSEINEFVSEINAIKGALPVRITLLACDAKLTEGGPWTYEPWEDFSLPRQFTGGGGTSFEPVFEWVDSQGLRPDVLVYFTDALGDFPPQAPGYPVLWLVKGKGIVPWGRRVQLN